MRVHYPLQLIPFDLRTHVLATHPTRVSSTGLLNCLN